MRPEKNQMHKYKIENINSTVERYLAVTINDILSRINDPMLMEKQKNSFSDILIDMPYVRQD